MRRIKAGPRGKTIPAISEAEWVVMRVLWERNPLTANEVVQELAPYREWKPKTVHTLIRRLVDKGAVAYEKRGREFLFQPLVDERECQLAESRSFLGRVFGGEMAPFLAAFVEREQLSAAEIDELKRVLDGGQTK
ncbi:MAG: BlaI/MecI/CopY family transcriptional regulator [Verrucomicrobiales bacterium]